MADVNVIRAGKVGQLNGAGLSPMESALSPAAFEKLGDGALAGAIPGWQGVAAFGDTSMACRRCCVSTLDWLRLGLRIGQALPARVRAEPRRSVGVRHTPRHQGWTLSRGAGTGGHSVPMDRPHPPAQGATGGGGRPRNARFKSLRFASNVGAETAESFKVNL